MTPTYHPQEETLMSLTAGTLGAGPCLVLETHLAGCAACRKQVQIFEAVGGVLLNSETTNPISPDLLDHTFARMSVASVATVAHGDRVRSMPPELKSVPLALLNCDIGPWRFIQPGLKISRVSIPGRPEANVILLKVAAGHQVPQHGHRGAEYTQVLSGAFSDTLGHYRAGDCIEADEDIDHQPIADDGDECICLAAVEGRLRLHSFVARILQPFLGI